MYARVVDHAAARLRGLRHETWEDLGLAALGVVLAVATAAFLPELAVPLLVGGLAMGVLGLRAQIRHWDVVKRLSAERDAYVIPEVLAYASREAEIDRRQFLAAMIRSHLPQPGLGSKTGLAAAAEELAALAHDLDNRKLALDPAAAVACRRLLIGIGESTLDDPELPPEEMRSRICQIRSGFKRQPDLALTKSGDVHELSGDQISSSSPARG